MHQLLCGIQRYLRDGGKREVDFFGDVAYKYLVDILDSRIKNLQQSVVKKQATPITNEEESKLWELGLLGDSTPQVLLDTLIWMCGLYFALRGGVELRELKHQQIELHEVSDGPSYLQYYENVSKNNAGGLKQRKIEAKVVPHYENTANPG